ncbi:MAG TPA: hypothetical protein VFA33_23505 [Bryobacteraceae bacterium]|nr:hypothetical protein [Bryobacteraceae bacterium]
MPGATRPISFRDYLPAVFRADEVSGVSFLSRFLQAFEELFEELEAEIEGQADGSGGGIPSLFDPAVTPPPEFQHLPQPPIDYLAYLASWIALPLREDKDLDWNRRFFQAAIGLYAPRSTLAGMEALLQAWLRDDLLDLGLPLLNDLARAYNGVDTILQLDVSAQLDFGTVLGEGPPFFFLADLTADPATLALRQPGGLDNLQRQARRLLDLEKPAHTYYELRLRALPMQLAAPGETEIGGRPAAQLDETALIWDEPLIVESD